MGKLILLLIGIACIYASLALHYSDWNIILKWVLQMLLGGIICVIASILFDGNNSNR